MLHIDDMLHMAILAFPSSLKAWPTRDPLWAMARHFPSAVKSLALAHGRFSFGPRRRRWKSRRANLRQRGGPNEGMLHMGIPAFPLSLNAWPTRAPLGAVARHFPSAVKSRALAHARFSFGPHPRRWKSRRTNLRRRGGPNDA